jgi:hypothetical protein
VEQLDSHAAVGDHLGHERHRRRHLEAAVESGYVVARQRVRLGPFEPEPVAVEPEGRVEIGDAQTDVVENGVDGSTSLKMQR